MTLPRLHLAGCLNGDLQQDGVHSPALACMSVCLPVQNMKWKLNTVNLQCGEEGSGRVGSVASNRLCFLPCKRLMCAERSDTDECKEFAVKTLRPF